jgi:protein O-mannosyl-transferase
MPKQVIEKSSGRGRTVAGAIFLGILVLVAYIPALSAGYVWDDDALLTKNPNVRSLEGLRDTWADPRANADYYPLTHTSFWVEYHLWKYAPLGYHLDNILLHAANAVLVWLILRRLAVPGAWAAAAIFALHPVQVEAVAWIAERKSVLGGLFCLLSVWLFVRVTLAGDDLSARRRWLMFGFSLACFALALLARPVMMAAAAVLPLVVWYKRGRLSGGDCFRIAWYWVLAAVVAPITIWVQYAHVGASGETFDYSALERVLIAGRALWFYAGKLVWPYPLIFGYDKWPIDAGVWWQWLYPAGAAAVLASLVLLRRRIGLGLLIGAGVFAVMLSPALGFFNVYWHRYYFVADHMQYLACLGLIVPAAAVAARLGTWARPASWGAAGVLLVVLGAMTWQQAGIYKDEETVWTDTLRKNRDSWLALNNRGDFYCGEGRYDAAISDYDKAIKLKAAAVTYNNRGNVRKILGQYDAAIADYDKAIDLAPGFAEAYYGRGNACDGKGWYDAAIQNFDKAIELRSDYVDVYVNRGIARSSRGQHAAAIEDFDRAIVLKPGHAMAYYNRAVSHFRMKVYDKAWDDVKTFRKLGGTPNPAFIEALTRSSGRSE